MRPMVRRAIAWMIVGAVVLPAPELRGQDARSTIAVLPFENSGSYGQDRDAFDALEVGLPAILGATLAAHPSVTLVERSRLDQTLGRQKLAAAHRLDAGSATEVAKATGARYAVSGSFADFYGKFRINARVVDAETGQILKVVSNDDPKLQDRAQLGAIVQLVADRIVDAMGLAPYPPGVAARRRAVSTDALTEFSRGLMSEQRGDRAKAAEAYQRALSSAPDLDEARSGLQRVKGG
jgi:TolB-like protein